MPVIFPHVNNGTYSISDADFCNAWAELIALYPESGIANQLPRLHSINPLQAVVNNGQQFSLEYLCRILVPNGYKNTMQATNIFMDTNSHIVQRIQVLNPVSGRMVQGAQLILNNVLAPNNPDIESLFEADCDELEEVGEISPIPVQTAIQNFVVDYIDAFVDQINSEPYQPMYRGKKIGKQVIGWDTRLQVYFWPNPRIGIIQTEARLQPLLARCQILATAVQAGRSWSPNEEIESVVVANEIFKWGGVPQNPVNVTWKNVRNVFEAAITGTVTPGTFMNSGWTKVAAFATNHLGNAAQVIWDSRVATSIIRRLDNIFHNAGLVGVPSAYSGIGRVAGQGGTRKNPPALSLKWRNGYGRWDAQFVGSAFVQKVCQTLNERKIRMTMSDGTSGNWTVRGVEMVLFGDGY